MKKQVFFLSIIIIHAIGFCCTSPDKQQLNTRLAPADSVTVNASINPAGNRNYIRYFNNNNIEYIAVLEQHKSQLCFYSIDASENEFCIKFNNPFQNQDLIEDFFVQSLDSIFLLSRNTNVIALADTTKRIKKRWQVTQPMQSGNLNYTLYSFSGPLHYQKGKIFTLQINPLEGMFTKAETREKYYKENNGVIITLTGDSAIVDNSTGKFPEEFRPDNTYFTFCPNTCVNTKGEYIFAYSPLSEITIYRPDGGSYTAEARSSYHQDMKPCNSDSLLNSLYTSQYEITNYQYHSMYYDPFRNRYYRVYLHGIPFDNQDGTVNTFDDKPWSLMILDENFKLIGEQKFTPAYNFRDIIISKKGLLVSHVPPIGSTKGLTYTAFTIN